MRNVAPDLTTDGAAVALSGQPYTLRLGVTDPGVDTLVQWVVDWGDGSAIETFAGSVREVQHVFAVPERSHTIQVGAFDEDGAWSAAPRVVEVVNDLLWVRTFTPDDSGFRVRFNRAFDPAPLNLYESAIAPRGGPDLEVKDASGNVIRGSMVLDADQQGFAFVATAGLAAGSSYDVTLSARGDGFVDALGRPLDGNRDNVGGDSYRTVFTIMPTTAPTVSVAHTVAGPKQTTDVPATARGIPVSLTTTQPATEIRFNLRYDPANLSVVGFEAGADLPSGSTFTVTGTPGNLAVRIVASSPVAAGVRELVRIAGSVPASATYAGAHVLDVVDAFVDGRDAREADGVHIVAYLGDTTGDGRYTNLDGQRVNRIVAGLDSGLGAYNRFDPVLLGDVDRDGALTSADATIITRESQFVFGGNAQFDRVEIPPIPVAQQTPAPGTNAVPVGAPIPPAPVVVPEPSDTAGAMSAPTGEITSEQWMAQAMRELNRMRLPSLPSQDLSMRFLNGQRTWENVVNRPVSASDSWRVTLPPMPADTPLPDGVPEDTPSGTLAALRYLVRKKLGAVKS